MRYFHYWLLILLSFGCFSASQAHEMKPGVVNLTIQENNEFILTLKVNVEALMADIDAKHTDTDNSPQSAIYNNLRKSSAETIQQKFNKFSANYQKTLNLKADNKSLSLNFNNIQVPPIDDIRLSRNSIITFSGKLPQNTKYITWQYPEKYGDNVFKLSQNGKSIASLWLTNGEQTDTIVLQEQHVTNSLLNYLWLGFLHILPRGLDHILFILGLFLFSTQIKPLFYQVSAFTLAHTITLGLSIYGIIVLPILWIEALIALSIVYIALENLLKQNISKWRLLVVFCFGLLHGLGFASVLNDIGLERSQFLSSLISFNIGVELGQLFIILLAYVFIGYWFKDKPWYRSRIVAPASIIIASIGLYWFYERIIIAI
ncbi:HupE/UreJ family protein [Candidatus Thioglobus sp.]|nr:HupE/UreJ family protein [Candidatus Thioglobus sp.]MDC0888377.1 HupE/UreJ family protein [Candidatus Thioglobus sp.]MDC0965109.1 HupE/UreJ family protein [Candidatus Thioglobus sp.]